MIYLLTPPPAARISGGFRVNEALLQGLTATGTGVGIHAAPGEVTAKIQSLPLARPAHVVLDSLYLTSLDPARLSQALTPRSPPIQLHFLLHFLPCMDPFLSPSRRKALQGKERALLALADKVLVPGSTLAGYLKKESLYGGMIYHCPPGIEPTYSDTSLPDPWEKDPAPKLITVGALSRSKGQLEILSQLQRMAPSFKGTWRLFGDTHIEPETYRQFKKKLNNSHLQKSVYVGHGVSHSRIGRALAGADLLVSASHFESYGMAIAEAVAAGVPVLAYRVGQIQQWIKEGKNGFLIPVGDQKGLKAALEKLLLHPEECLRLKKQAQKTNKEIAFPTWKMAFQCFLKAFEA